MKGLDEDNLNNQLAVELSDFIETPLAKAIVLLRALGFDSSEITAQFQISEEAQKYLITDVPLLSELFDKYDINTKESEQEKLVRLAKIALNVKQRILTDESAPINLRNSVATEIYEQVYGKAKQKVETVNYNIDANDNMDKLKAGLATLYSRLTDMAKKKGLLEDGQRDVIEVE